MQNNGALKGITVLDIPRLLPGPYCSTILADHGARVIAIEDRRFKDQVTYIEALYCNDDRHRRQIIEFMRRVFKQKTLEEWEQALSRLDVCYQPVQNFEKALKDPFFREHETVLNIPEKAGGNATTIGVPIKLSRTPGAIRSAPVRFGESTAAVLGRLGDCGQACQDHCARPVS